MFTIKLSPKDDNTRIEEAQSAVTLIRCGEADYEALTKGLSQPELPRVIISYTGADGEWCRRFLYAEDRAWIMNANGKTVATV
ncbi:MAG: hypothetical protein LPK08_02465 [Halomonas sp.]|nr:hypothetical protein [Halomonas sp.]